MVVENGEYNDDRSVDAFVQTKIISDYLGDVHKYSYLRLQLAMKFFRSRKVDLNIRMWELGVRQAPKEIVPFINQSKDTKGAEFQIRLVGSSGYAALGEPIRVFDYLFNSDDSIREKFLSSRSMVLDHGCGVGRFSVVLGAYGKDLKCMYGVDVLEDCVQNYGEIVGAPAGSVLKQDIKDLVGVDFFDSTISYSVFTHLPKLKAEECLRDLFSVTKNGGIVVLTVWNERLLGYLGSSSYSSSNGYWWENMKQTIGQYTSAELSDQGFIFAPNSGGDGLPSEVYGDTIYSLSYFAQLVERVGWKVRAIINDDSLTLQSIVVLERKD
jgi:2-polyprenyl-3-methyl-5-hydroxy-6-metoxy-1,4-benzoquinol methylase